jgi:hypothetical protein
MIHPRRRSWAAAALVALTAAGCGLEEGPPQTPARGSRGVVPKPRVTTTEMVTWLRDVAQARTCAPTRRLLHPVYRRSPARTCRGFRDRLLGLLEAEGKRYGTGMVIDFTTIAGARRAAVLALDGTHVFRLVLIVDVAARTVGTKAPKAFDIAARRAIRSLAQEDCRGFLRVAARSAGVATASRAEVCARVPRLGLTHELLAHPSVRPERLGGNRAFAFYGLRFAPGSFYTVLMLREPRREGAPARYGFVTALPAK